MARSTARMGILGAISTTSGTILSIALGAGMVDLIGRKFVLMLCLVAQLITGLFFLAGSFWHDSGGDFLLLIGSGFGSLSMAYSTASIAMASDLVPKDSASRAGAYGFLAIT